MMRFNLGGFTTLLPLVQNCIVTLRILLLEVCLLSACLLGDYLLENSFILPDKRSSNSDSNGKIILWKRALADSVTHGMVGLFSWAIVINFDFKASHMLSLFFCFFLATAVDIDHFLEARSTDIKAAMNLQRRPPFHSTTAILVVAGLVWTLNCIFNSRLLKIFYLMFITAWLSHHIRDATRRGLWFPPFGSTPSIPYKLYLCLIILLPLIVKFLYHSSVENKNMYTDEVI